MDEGHESMRRFDNVRSQRDAASGSETEHIPEQVTKVDHATVVNWDDV
jgi:hypothetical protein